MPGIWAEVDSCRPLQLKVHREARQLQAETSMVVVTWCYENLGRRADSLLQSPHYPS
jgi:hypothetical protein